VPPDLDLVPTELQAAAVAVRALLPALQLPALDAGDLDALDRLPGGAQLTAEHDRLVASVGRAGRELSELAAALQTVTTATEEAERDAVRSVTTANR
jgi:hypothetical protein